MTLASGEFCSVTGTSNLASSAGTRLTWVTVPIQTGASATTSPFLTMVFSVNWRKAQFISFSPSEPRSAIVFTPLNTTSTRRPP
ncbi:hypothetical protein GALL_536250 [mine drainage metagenome]|uniref:Uncharacterized protein n=1 Tax=mine drainage metagenome TaxID=410659 RepID=A0A1J5P149_9ZZZZ